jgi:hypothetical protein
MLHLIKACNSITKISSNPDENKDNYMEGLNYISNLYTFLNELKLYVPAKNDIEFLPTFKGRNIVEKMGISSTDKENEMKVFKLRSSLFLEDELVKTIRKGMSSICERIVLVEDVMSFYLP